MITIQKLNETKTVNKPWGQETWIQSGQNEHSYVLKEIILNSGYKTSLQVHKYKAETNYILEGHGRIVYSDIDFNCDKYLAGLYTEQELADIMNNLKVQTYSPGTVMTINPGTIHRMIADTELRFVEASTCHLDDVIRLKDDSNRLHGRIDSEHQ
jgi:mannose-6-phosphate isomerase-like protein (cupin superfamily)